MKSTSAVRILLLILVFFATAADAQETETFKPRQLLGAYVNNHASPDMPYENEEGLTVVKQGMSYGSTTLEFKRFNRVVLTNSGSRTVHGSSPEKGKWRVIGNKIHVSFDDRSIEYLIVSPRTVMEYPARRLFIRSEF